MRLTKRASTIKAPSQSTEWDGAFLNSRFHAKILDWYARNKRALPWRLLWKRHQDPWHIWVSEIMLQQTVIKAVLPVYQRFLKQFPTPTALAKASPDDIRLAVRGLGYYRRFDLLHKACVKLHTERRGLPTTHEEWLGLPGVGPYTAAAISSITTNAPYGVVDGNVERVLCRLLDIRTEPNLPHLKKRFKVIMDDLCSLGHSGQFNQAVMELGQSVCVPSQPSCPECPVRSKCLAFANSSQALAPAAKSKPEKIDVNLRLGILQVHKKIALIRRPDDAKFLKGTWGFETFIQSPASGPSPWRQDGTSHNRAISRRATAIGMIKHNITKHKISAEVLIANDASALTTETMRLFSPHDVERHIVSNLDRKAWQLFLKIKSPGR